MTKTQKQDYLKIIPLGGLGEVGRNMMLLEFKGEILILDMGFRMPEENMPGVDYIIPNIEYLKDKKEKILGAVFTHGHYDHIGAIPYLLPKIWHPNLLFFASPLTRAIILKRQEDFPNQPKLNIKEVYDKSRVKIGPFVVEFVKMNHNIPDNFGLFIETPVGNLFHTSDFKFDKNPSQRHSHRF
jgi:ribonuclease J